MAELMNTVMPEDGSWPEGIYQIETSDPVLGYDPKTGVDGPANTQWHQLANRTRYLRNLFLVGHDEDGRHKLTNDDFVTEAGILEENIILDYPTLALAEEITVLQQEIQTAIDMLENDIAANIYGLAWAMLKIIPLAWERQGDRCMFELFTPSLTMALNKDYHVTKAVYDHEDGIGDDSIDIDAEYSSSTDVGNMNIGEWYVLCSAEDSTVWQFVSIANILTDDRILINEESVMTITDGWLRSANVKTGTGPFTASGSFAWISGLLSPMDNGDPITITIRHDKHTDCVPVVEYIPESGDAQYHVWTEASGYYKESSEQYEDDVCTIPPQSSPFHLRISYEHLDEPLVFSMIALVERHEYDEIELIRKPSVQSATVSGNQIIVLGSPYRSLYEIEQNGMDVQGSATQDFFRASTQSVLGAVETMTIPRGNTAYVRVRYHDNEGVVSRWSDPKAVE